MARHDIAKPTPPSVEVEPKIACGESIRVVRIALGRSVRKDGSTALAAVVISK